MTDPSIFKAYDVRGLYADQMDEALAYRIGRAFPLVLAELQGGEPGELRVGLGVEEEGLAGKARSEQRRDAKKRLLGSSLGSRAS